MDPVVCSVIGWSWEQSKRRYRISYGQELDWPTGGSVSILSECTRFDVSAAARRFLEAFCKLRVEHPPSIELKGREIFCWTEFDPARVCTERDARIAGRCARVASESLCPLGIDGFHLTVYVSPSGRFYAGMDSSVFAYADHVDEFFAKLAGGSRPQLIGNWEL
ncbi:SUKH-3 domain-containing protein [Streptomyces sp. NPDC001480]|uniref:SUKH-3 domain-containing protein n=1 Tax=Streptomyces sp. NPDC001480 TaxID=3364577 RepID=UPI0036772877